MLAGAGACVVLSAGACLAVIAPMVAANVATRWYNYDKYTDHSTDELLYASAGTLIDLAGLAIPGPKLGKASPGYSALENTAGNFVSRGILTGGWWTTEQLTPGGTLFTPIFNEEWP